MSDPIPTSAIPDTRRPGFGTSRGFGRLGPERLLVVMTNNNPPDWTAGGYVIWGRDGSGGWPLLPSVVWQGWRGSRFIEFGFSYPNDETNSALLSLSISRGGALPLQTWQTTFTNFRWNTGVINLSVQLNGAIGLCFIRFVPNWLDMGVVYPTLEVLDKFP